MPDVGRAVLTDAGWLQRTQRSRFGESQRKVVPQRLRRLFGFLATDQQRQTRFQSTGFVAALPRRLVAGAVHLAPPSVMVTVRLASLRRQLDALGNHRNIVADAGINPVRPLFDFDAFVANRHLVVLSSSTHAPVSR